MPYGGQISGSFTWVTVPGSRVGKFKNKRGINPHP